MLLKHGGKFKRIYWWRVKVGDGFVVRVEHSRAEVRCSPAVHDGGADYVGNVIRFETPLRVRATEHLRDAPFTVAFLESNNYFPEIG
jgi:hypothetical protein